MIEHKVDTRTLNPIEYDNYKFCSSCGGKMASEIRGLDPVSWDTFSGTPHYLDAKFCPNYRGLSSIYHAGVSRIVNEAHVR